MENDEYDWISLTILGIVVLIIVAIILQYKDVDIEMDCKIEGIELKDVRPNVCYDGFAAQHCPIPKNIDCSIKGKIPYVMVKDIK